MKKILLFMLLLLISCKEEINNYDFDEIKFITKAKDINCDFLSNDLLVTIHNSSLSSNEKKDLSTLISLLIFKEVFLKDKDVFKEGKITLVFKNNIKQDEFSFNFTDLIIVDNLSNKLFDILYSKDIRQKYLKNKNDLSNKMNIEFENEKREIEIKRIDIDNVYYFYLDFYSDKEPERYRFSFNKTLPNNLLDFEKVK